MFHRTVRFESSFRVFKVSLVILVIATLAVAANGQDADKAENASDAKVPVKRVVLFSSGVGYFEHGGKVEGDANVDLKFNVDDVNDLLKSMVLQDLSGGKISTVTYGSRDPITKTLQTFAIDLTQNPTLSQLLGQIRGERVELETTTTVKGTIVGVETKKQQVGDNQVIDVDYLNLLTNDGLRRIALDSIGRIKLANEELDKEFRRALGILATGHATDKKTVTLKFLGEGERDVRVGYIQEAPVWKTSYRLVLDDEDKPFLQGWAIVENTTDTDWQDVNLSLVSGRPISFVMDLYSPLYAERPTVVPELYASLRPQVYEQDLGGREKQLEEMRRRVARSSRAAASPAAKAEQESHLASGQMSGPAGGLGGAAPADYFGRESLSGSVDNAAQSGDVGELFQYNIKDAVTLARQRSAMLPIINDTVQGEKVSIYNANVHAKHPLNGIQLKNSSDLHLMQGPVTVFDGGVYAGDARISDMPPGSDRLMSYAMDLDVEVAPTSDSKPRNLLSARIEKGTFIATYKQSRTQKYVVKNSGGKEKKVLLEHPIEARWELITPKEPAEKTRDVYRFAIAAKPGEPANMKIEEQITIREDIAVSNLNDDAIHFFLSANVVSETVKEGLREVVRRKSELAGLHRENQRIEQEIATIGQEQQRIRENMKSIDRNTDLYNRYVKKFTDQEDAVEKLRDEGRALQQKIVELQRFLDEYLSKLELA
jgi:hypothetical protein